MEMQEPCPLTPALVQLLQAASDADTTDAGKLADLLCLSKNTIRTQWQQILERLGAHSRHAAVLLAIRRGWISFPTAPGTPPDEST